MIRSSTALSGLLIAALAKAEEDDESKSEVGGVNSGNCFLNRPMLVGIRSLRLDRIGLRAIVQRNSGKEAWQMTISHPICLIAFAISSEVIPEVMNTAIQHEPFAA